MQGETRTNDARAELDEATLERVRASYSRCRAREDFIPAFYERLWSLEPAVRDLFSGADMSRQHLMMREAINSLLMYARGSVVAAMSIDRVGVLHSRTGYGVHPRMYDAFARALVEVVEGIDPQADEALLASWRKVVTPGLRRIAAAY